MKDLPEVFIERLKEIIPAAAFDRALRSFSEKKPVSVRVNTLKTDREKILALFREREVAAVPVDWYADAFVLGPGAIDKISDLIEEGRIYQQGLASMVPALILGPKPGERVLDLCAAPGSKSSQIAALMGNEGPLVCVEAIKDRFYRLRSVLQKLGVTNAELKIMDGRKFRIRPEKDKEEESGMFDRVLVDAPCSSEGRFQLLNKKTTAYWSLRKIRDMVQKQRGLILNAARCLKPGGVLVYSTCTFAPEENEGVIGWVLKKGQLKIVPAGPLPVETYPAVPSWKEKIFFEDVDRCLRILPTEKMDGFFIAKLVRI